MELRLHKIEAKTVKIMSLTDFGVKAIKKATFICPFCKIIVKSEESLQAHLFFIHFFKCPDCCDKKQCNYCTAFSKAVLQRRLK